MTWQRRVSAAIFVSSQFSLVTLIGFRSRLHVRFGSPDKYQQQHDSLMRLGVGGGVNIDNAMVSAPQDLMPFIV
jgi:hypothetical protein